MPYQSYGKFDSAITEVLYNMTMDQCQDEEEGEADMMGWFARFNGGIDRETIERYANGDFSVELEDEDYEALESCAGAILQNDSQGFVYSSVFDSATELNKQWNQVLKMYEDAYAEENEEN